MITCWFLDHTESERLLSLFIAPSLLASLFPFPQSRLQHELKKVPKLQKFWNLIKKKYDKMDADAAEQCVIIIFVFPLSAYCHHTERSKECGWFHTLLNKTLLSYFPSFRAKKEQTFLSALIDKFLGVLGSIPPSGNIQIQLRLRCLDWLMCCIAAIWKSFLHDTMIVDAWGASHTHTVLR